MEEVATVSIGPKGGKCALFTVVVGCVGAIIGFLILIGDVIVPLAEALCSSSSSSSSGSGSGSGSSSSDSASAVCDFFTSRTYMILSFAILIVIPVSSLPNFSHLTIGSFLAVFSLAVVVASVIYIGAVASNSADFRLPENSIARSSWTVVLGIPIAVFSLGNHSQVAQISFEVSKLDRIASRSFYLSVIAATALCVVVYLFTGIYGYIAFGNETQGDILLNFGIHDTTAAICRCLMAFHIALALPVQVIPLRSALLQHYSHILGRITDCTPASTLSTYNEYEKGKTDEIRDSGFGGGGKGNLNTSTSTSTSPVHAPDSGCDGGVIYFQDGSDISFSKSNPSMTQSPSSRSSKFSLGLIIITALIVLPCATTAIFLPEIAIVFGLLGSSVSTLQIYILPGYMLWSDSYRFTKSRRNHDYSCAEANSGPNSEHHFVSETDSQGHENAADDENYMSYSSNSGRGEDGGYSSEGVLVYMPKTAENRRYCGLGVILLGLCIAVVGTTINLLAAFDAI